MDSLIRGEIYTNQDICINFRCSLYRGMNRSLKTNTLILISKNTNSLYSNKWIGDTMNYTGEGQKGNQSLNF
jgi:5-methylcytosine-specific restriction enzyme A